MRISWLGNATVIISHEGSALVTDPFVSRNPAHQKLVDEDLLDVRAVLVTHGHFDHVSDLPGFMERLKLPAYLTEPVERDLAKRYGVRGLHRVAPNHPMEIGSLTVTAYPAKHVRLDLAVMRDALSGLVSYGVDRDRWLAVARTTIDHLEHPMGECVAWHVEANDRSILHFGSLGMDPQQDYPRDVDVLSLAYQGTSKAAELALGFIEVIRPKSLYLHHFDDAFPPLSSHMSPEPLVELMAARYPEVTVIVPSYRTPLTM